VSRVYLSKALPALAVVRDSGAKAD
jgi:hypothetical protein